MNGKNRGLKSPELKSEAAESQVSQRHKSTMFNAVGLPSPRQWENFILGFQSGTLALPLLLVFSALSSVLFSASAQADSPGSARQIRAAYTRLDAAYSRRDVPAILAFLAPHFERVTWNAMLAPAQFEAKIKDDFDGPASASAVTRLESLTVHGDTADAVAVRRVDYTFTKPLPELLPPYFHVSVTQEAWQKTNGVWRMTKIADTPLVQTLDLLNFRDQTIRFRHIADPKNKALDAQEAQVDAADQVRLKQIIRQYGWPGFDLAGTDGDEATWEIVQHSDNDKAFQKRCLPLIQAAVKRGQSSPSNFAYLTDRILIGEHKPQIYGTQMTFKRDAQGHFIPRPIVDPAHVDERRASVGLGPLAAYEAQFQQLYQSEAKP